MTFPKSYYVTLTKINEMAFPLGFATPDGTDAAAKKRKSTADYWAKLPQTITFDNEPISGFSFGNSVSRYSTSNKFIRVSDPRGFVLEISIANLCDIIEEHTIVKGDIEGLFVWGRENANNILISANNSEYIQSLEPKETLEIGDWYVIREDTEYTKAMEYCYLGPLLTTLGEKIHHYSEVSSGWNRQQTKLPSTWEYTDDPKKWHISSALERRWSHENKTGPLATEIHMRRTKPKIFKKIKRKETLELFKDVEYNCHSVNYAISTVKIRS